MPWIFVVLVLLNAGLFLWGYQREKALEPPRTPVPEGSYEIYLFGEAREGQQRDAEDSNDPGPNTQAASDERLVTRRLPAEADIVSSPAPEVSGAVSELADHKTDVGAGDAPAGETAETATGARLGIH